MPSYATANMLVACLNTASTNQCRFRDRSFAKECAASKDQMMVLQVASVLSSSRLYSARVGLACCWNEHLKMGRICSDWPPKIGRQEGGVVVKRYRERMLTKPIFLQSLW